MESSRTQKFKLKQGLILTRLNLDWHKIISIRLLVESELAGNGVED